MSKRSTLFYGSVLVCILLLTGCIYSDAFDSGMQNYVLLYDKQTIAQDSGWTDEQAESFKIPLWEDIILSDREQVGAVDAGTSVRVLRKTKQGYQVVTPKEGDIGWVEKIYVKREYTIDVPETPLPHPRDAQEEEASTAASKVIFVTQNHEQ
jgi:hypothetical protein